MKRKLLLTLAVLLGMGTAKAQTDRWIFPLVFTDATNNPDTVWFVQYDSTMVTLNAILEEEGINPNVDTTNFCVYFEDGLGNKTKISAKPFGTNFEEVRIDSKNIEFPIRTNWDRNIVNSPCEPYGAVTYSTIESEYIGIYSVEGWLADDDDYDPWGNIFSYIDSTGPQPAAYYSEYGQYYGEEDMLQPLCESFFPMYITITRKHFHSGNIHGLTASTNGHNVILNWNYGGCEHIDHFEVYRGTLGGTILSNHTTTETHFEEENVPAGQYEYMIDGYFTDGSHIYDPILYSPYPSVTVEVQDDTVPYTFAPAGAEWYFNMPAVFEYPTSYYKMEVLGDTVIQGHTCSIISPHYLGGGNQYVYEEGRVVYWYNKFTDAFTVLYDFNAEAGDSWICDINYCSCQVTVNSIDSVTWEGHTYRVQNVLSLYEVDEETDYYSQVMAGKIIDGIGYEHGLFPNMLACEGAIVDGQSPEYLRCYLKDGEMLYHEGHYNCDEIPQTDWIFPLVFTDASNNPDTVWFVQHDYVTTLEDILNEEGINPNVRDENEFRVYFMQDGEKTRVVSSHFDEAFIKEQIYADNYVFPITMDWRKILLEQYFEFFGPMAFTSLENGYTEAGFTIEGVEVIDGEIEWYGVFNTYETTGLQPAAYYSEEGTYYGDEEMLQSFYTNPTFFPMAVSMSRSCLYHNGSLSGLTANVEGNDVILDWFYTGCDYPEAFTVTRVPENESEAITFTTSETAFVDHGVPAGHYTYAINAYYSDGTYISDGIYTQHYSIEVTVEETLHTWPKPGAQWTYQFYVATQGPEGMTTETLATEIWSVTGDSVVGGRAYKVIKPIAFYCTFGNLYIDENKMLLTRSSNDTVYRYVNNQEYVYFVFNMEEGDTYTTYRSAGWSNYGNDSTCTSVKPLRAIETSTVTIGNRTLKKTVLEDTIFGELYQKDWNKDWTLVERIGIVGQNYPLIDEKESMSNNSCYYMLLCAEFDGLVRYRDYEFDTDPTFSSSGAEWYYELQNPDGSITYQHLYYLADTTIREKNIDIIVRTNTLYDKGTNTTHEYIYEENGKVYWWNAAIDDFTMLYDFTAMPGDEWEIKVGTESITMHVDAVGETEYNNKIFKTLQVSDAGNLFSGTIVAKVGHLTSFFPEKLMRKSGESTVEGLRCLWNDGTLVFKYGDKDCDEVYEQLHYGMGETTINTFSLYPNPTEDVLTVETQNLASPQKQTSYRILNLMGQTLLEGLTEGGSTNIDVSSLSNGMYFLTIEGVSQKFVIDK